MKVIDFLFYYLVLWFKKWGKVTDPISRAAYVLGICSLLWMILINGVIEFILFNSFKSKIPNIVFIILGVIFIAFFNLIYVKGRRYYIILERSNPKFHVSDKAGMVISIIFVFSSLLILMAITIILHSIK